MSFEQNLATGKVGESLIARWLMARGRSVMPVYEIEKSQGKGPQLFSASGEVVAPDMLVFAKDGIVWIEAKHKTVFTWHRNSSAWTTGIDLRHYEHYQQIEKLTKLPVWLLFFHISEIPNRQDVSFNCPKTCPTGLFAQSLAILVKQENHRSLPIDKSRDGYLGHGRSGMVYWTSDTLKLLASKDDVLKVRLAA